MHLESSVVVNRPVEEVWAFATDMFNLPRLGGGTLQLRQTTPGPIGVGATLHARGVILGFEGRVSGTITEWDPPHAFTVSARGAGIRSIFLRETYEVTAEGTKIVRVGEIERGPILKLLWLIVGPLLRRRWDAHTQNIKRLLEADRG